MTLVKTRWPANEVELAKPVIDWLTDLRWDVYQEVSLGYAMACADIVAVQNRIVWVIESKRSFTLDLIEQARSHCRYAHYISVAVPWNSACHSRMARDVCNWLGIGVLAVRQAGYPSDSPRVHELDVPKLHRRAWASKFLDVLRPEHKTFAEAGNANGRRFSLSPFQQTCIAIANYVRVHPGASLKDVIDSIDTHYASTATARSCIAKWASAGKIRGVRVERDDTRLKFYAVEET